MAINVIARDAGGNQAANTQTVFALQVVTSRGKVDTLTRINTALQFVRAFGEPTTLSALEAYQAAKLGVKLHCYRVGHYTDVSSPATKTGTKATATIGVAPNEIEFEAVEVGTGYNGIKIDVKSPISKKTGFVDIHVTLPEAGLTVDVINDIPTTITTSVQSLLNSKLEFFQLTSSTGTFAAAQTATFTGGAFDNSTIVDADIMGNATAKTGAYSFEFGEANLDYIVNIVSETHDVNNVYKAIASLRKKAAIGFAPIGITTANAIAYANASGSYSSETKL